MTFTRKDNGLNQYSGWWPYSVIKHDDDIPGWGVGGRANGVVMLEGWITGSYNALNQPVGVTTSAWNGSGNWMWFGYDPLGRCVKRWIGPHVNDQVPPANTNPATYYYYDGWNLIQEGLSGGTPDRVYVHGGRVDEWSPLGKDDIDGKPEGRVSGRRASQIVASWAGGDWSQHQYDAQGNCILLTDTNGLIHEQYDYDAFGFPYVYDRWGYYIGGLPGRNRFLFTGREWIKELRLYDYRNRLYQPELGRFLQPDPIQFEAGDYNLYRYCHNDPVNRNDPAGLWDSWTHKMWEQGGSLLSSALTQTLRQLQSAGTLAAVVIRKDGDQNKTFSSIYAAGVAGAAEAIPQAFSDPERKEWKGLMLESKTDRGVFVFTTPVRGTRGQVSDGLSPAGSYNKSDFDPANAPSGFNLVGGYWALPRYQLNWPEGDRRRLFNGRMDGVLGMPPPAAASSMAASKYNVYKYYTYDPNKYPPSDAPRR